jgi:hypothetical protein
VSVVFEISLPLSLAGELLLPEPITLQICRPHIRKPAIACTSRRLLSVDTNPDSRHCECLLDQQRGKPVRQLLSDASM